MNKTETIKIFFPISRFSVHNSRINCVTLSQVKKIEKQVNKTLLKLFNYSTVMQGYKKV